MRPTRKIYFVHILGETRFSDKHVIFLSKKEQDKYIAGLNKTNKSYDAGVMRFQKPYYFQEYKEG